MLALTLLVTAHHHGDLRYFPRLQTLVQRLRANSGEKVFLLDTGQAWANDSWVCAATENRAPYMLMDAMGYHSVIADGLAWQQRIQLQDRVQTQLLAPDTEATLKVNDHELRFRVDISLLAPVFNNAILLLNLPPHGTIMQIKLENTLISQIALFPVDSKTLPDPTIAATVELIEDEARYYQERKRKHP